MSSSHLLKSGLAVLLSLLCGSSASAVVLDWDATTWTPGYTNSFDVDSQNTGNDVTVSVSGDTAVLQAGSPTVTSYFQGGLAAVQKTLYIGFDLANQSQFVTITVNFSSLYLQGVENVSFTIFDVDFDNVKNSSEYQDQLRGITGLAPDGTTLVAPTITWSPNNTRTGSDLTQVVTGTATTADTGAGAVSSNGNVTISFGTNAIQSFTFRYGSGADTSRHQDPTYQHIGIHDISFTPVPEVNPAKVAIGLCGILAAGAFRQHARRRHAARAGAAAASV